MCEVLWLKLEMCDVMSIQELENCLEQRIQSRLREGLRSFSTFQTKECEEHCDTKTHRQSFRRDFDWCSPSGYREMHKVIRTVS